MTTDTPTPSAQDYAPCPRWCERHHDDAIGLRQGHHDRIHVAELTDHTGITAFSVSQAFNDDKPGLAEVCPDFSAVEPESQNEVDELVELFRQALQYALESNAPAVEADMKDSYGDKLFQVTQDTNSDLEYPAKVAMLADGFEPQAVQEVDEVLRLFEGALTNALNANLKRGNV